MEAELRGLGADREAAEATLRASFAARRSSLQGENSPTHNSNSSLEGEAEAGGEGGEGGEGEGGEGAPNDQLMFDSLRTARYRITRQCPQ